LLLKAEGRPRAGREPSLRLAAGRTGGHLANLQAARRGMEHYGVDRTAQREVRGPLGEAPAGGAGSGERAVGAAAAGTA